MSGRLPPKTMSPTQQVDGVSPALFRRQRFLRRLAVYRPLGVLASIWVVFLAIALLAYGQLLRTAPEAENAEPSGLESYPHERLDENSDSAIPRSEPSTSNEAATADEAEESSAGDRAINEDEAVDTGVNLWTLLALVGTCALGSWLLSVQLKSSPKRRKVRKKKPVAAQGNSAQAPSPDRPHSQPPAAAKPKAPAAPQKLAPYDPAQPLIKTAATRRPPSPAQPPSLTQTPSPAPASPELPSDVSVVAEEVQHRLDWPKDSLVNTADMRQRRSLSSFL